jgi:hypothetical protein
MAVVVGLPLGGKSYGTSGVGASLSLWLWSSLVSRPVHDFTSIYDNCPLFLDSKHLFSLPKNLTIFQPFTTLPRVSLIRSRLQAVAF